MPGSCETWEAYRDVAPARPEDAPARRQQRAVLWSIFERVRASVLARRADHASPGCSRGSPALLAQSASRRSTSSSWTRRRTSASRSCGSSPRSAAAGRTRLFFAGDLGQRIFQQPFSWKASASTSAGAPHAARQLPHLAPDPQRRPTACSARR